MAQDGGGDPELAAARCGGGDGKLGSGKLSAVSTLPFQATALTVSVCLATALSTRPVEASSDTVPMPDTPLHSACCSGDAAKATQLIQDGADLEAKDSVRQSR